MFQVNTTYDNYVNDLLIDDDYVVEENEFINLNGKLVRKIIYTNQSKNIIKHGFDINKKFVIE